MTKKVNYNSIPGRLHGVKIEAITFKPETYAGDALYPIETMREPYWASVHEGLQGYAITGEISFPNEESVGRHTGMTGRDMITVDLGIFAVSLGDIFSPGEQFTLNHKPYAKTSDDLRRTGGDLIEYL